jgi:hypothetical protein
VFLASSLTTAFDRKRLLSRRDTRGSGRFLYFEGGSRLALKSARSLGCLRRAMPAARRPPAGLGIGREGRAGSRVIRMHTTLEHTVSTVSSARHQGSRSGSKEPQPADDVRDNRFAQLVLDRAGLGHGRRRC